MKRRSLTVLLCLLAIISLASVGFASWVISAGDTEEATGNIQVEEVTDRRLEITELKIENVAYGSENMPTFIFGAEDEKSLSWLTNKTKEVLSLTLSFKVVYKNDKKPVTDAVISVEFGANDSTVFGDWITIENENPTATHKGEGVYECELTLDWGPSWDGKNPFTFYAGKDANKPAYYLTKEDVPTKVETLPEGANANEYVVVTWADDANTKLTEMYTALKTAQYKVKITANPAAPSVE